MNNRYISGVRFLKGAFWRQYWKTILIGFNDFALAGGGHYLSSNTFQVQHHNSIGGLKTKPLGCSI